jgi:hypothetical protein
MRENVEPALTLEQLRTLLPHVEKDFDTPEGAVLCLEDACRRQNIESACICKNFMVEGTLKLLDLDPNLARDPEFRKKNALLLERTYRMTTPEAWPDLKGVESFFIQFFISVGYREARFGHRFCPQTYCNAPELAPGIVY